VEVEIDVDEEGVLRRLEMWSTEGPVLGRPSTSSDVVSCTWVVLMVRRVVR
jgi:hypothetical protein